MSHNKRQRRTREDRAKEYINSPLMSHRIQHKGWLSVLISGRYGIYRTSLDLDRAVGFCTCPSDEIPCKHVRALGATWDVNPHSFFDLDSFLTSLQRKRKSDLVDDIGRLCLADPTNLGHLGVSGFASFEDEDADDDEW